MLCRRPALLLQQARNLPKQSPVLALLPADLSLPVHPVLTAVRCNIPAETDPCTMTLAGHSDWVQSLSVCVPSGVAVSGSLDGTCRLWNLSTGHCLSNMRATSGAVNAVTFLRPVGDATWRSGCESFACGCSDGSVQLWDVKTQTRVWQTPRVHAVRDAPDSWQHGAGRHGLAFKDAVFGTTAVVQQASAGWLLTAGQDGTVHVLSQSCGCRIGALTLTHTGVVSGLALHPADPDIVICCGRDGVIGVSRVVVSSDTEVLCPASDGSVMHAVVSSITLITAFASPVKAADVFAPLTCVAMSPCGHFVAVGTNDNAVHVFRLDLASTPPVLGRDTAIPADSPVKTVQFAAATPTLLVGTDNGSCVMRFNEDFSKVVSTLDLRGHSYPVTTVVETSPDTVMTSSRDGTLKQWLLPSTDKAVDATSAFANLSHTACVTHALCVNSLLATVSSDCAVKLFDVGCDAAGVPQVSYRATLTAHDVCVYAVAMDPSRGRFATCTWGKDRNLMHVWDTASLSLVRTFSDHSDGVVWAVFSPRYTFLASCSMDSTAIIYDADSFEKRAVLSGHTGGVRALSFSPDGGTFLPIALHAFCKVTRVSLVECLQRHRR